MTKTPRKSSEEIKEETALRKAEELSTLCGIEVCMISYGVNGVIKTFPEDQHRVAAMASRFTHLSEASRSKKSTSLHHVLKDIHSQKMKNTKTKEKTEKVVDVDANLLGSHFDAYSIDELNRKLDSIRRKIQSINEYRENMKKIDHVNLDTEVQSVGDILKAPSTQVPLPEREGLITFGPIATNNSLVPTENTTVCQKVGNSSFSYEGQNYQIKQKKIDHRNIASSSAASSSSPPDLGFQSSKKIDYGNIASLSSSSSFPPDLGFENSNSNSNSNSNNIFDAFVEEDEFPLDPNFGFDLKEVDYLLRDYDHVEEETWNQAAFHQHNNINNIDDIQIQHHH